MISNRKVVIHVGYPKCASTFLQVSVLPHIPHIEFVGKWNNRRFLETILCPEIDFDPKDAAATIPAGDKPLVVSIEAMVAQLILRRAMLRIACLERDIPPLDLRFYGGAVLIAGIVAAKALSDLGAIHLLALSALSLTVWLIADRRTLSEAIYAVKPRIVSARISEP